MAYVTPPTFVADDVLAADELNILGDDIEYLKGITDGVVASGVQVYRDTNQATASGVAENVVFATENFDFGGYWSSGDTVTIPAGAIPAGFTSILVHVVGRIRWGTSGTGNRRVRALLNGVSFSSNTQGGIASDPTDQYIIDYTLAEAGDDITLEGYQTSGGALNIEVGVITVVRHAPGM